LTVVLDYGMGNLRSVEKAVQAVGYECAVQTDLTGADKLVIPGVGAFGAAMEKIGPLADEIRAFARSGKPVLGICLGQQLLFDGSDEHGKNDGLSLIPGWVKYLPANTGLKVPHIGWSGLRYRDGAWISDGGTDGEEVYFVHSLYTECDDDSHIAATANYGIEFAAAVQKENVWGTQFHPEKSSLVGMRILKRFLSC
jgi:glutamine amidotransferase